MRVSPQDYALRVLCDAGLSSDDGLEIGELALALAALDETGYAIQPYRDFLQQLVEDIRSRADPAPTLAQQISLLQGIVVGDYGFQGDRENYNDRANANLMRVIDRRRGLPVALGILYLHVARKLGWQLTGLSFPGHFLLRLEANGERAILDPFDRCAVRIAADLRHLLKATQGEEAELTPENTAPVSDRAVLLRLQNNLKLRRLQHGSLEDAVAILQQMVLFAPNEAMLWRELGLFQSKLGNLKSAITAFETFLALHPKDELAHQAALILQKLRLDLC